MLLEIKILGPGCPKCKVLKRHTLKAVEDLVKESPDITATVATVTDLAEILRYEVLGTPALVINERVVLVGKVPHGHEILDLLKAAACSGPAS